MSAGDQKGIVLPNRGRGATANPDGRYLDTIREDFEDGWHPDEVTPKIRTTVTPERAKSLINRNNSPDLPFTQSINPYRGCEHGCIYCYARPAHAFVDLSPGLDFESRLFSKPNAAELLRKELGRAKYNCSPISLGANTDAYQPVERHHKITRSILEVLAECEHPVTIISKSSLVERDFDLLVPMAEKNLVQVFISITTVDRTLARRLEPRAAAPQRRLETIDNLSAAGIPAGLMVAPIIPGLNDNEIENILGLAANRGAKFAGYVMLRLPREVRDLFKDWLETHYPLKYSRVMANVRDVRAGNESDSEFHRRLRGTGPVANLIKQRFEKAVRSNNLNVSRHDLNCQLFKPPAKHENQYSLF
ncbi:MAG: PA0069 family radical SAM protein [Gammaproteobacteria bacterium]